MHTGIADSGSSSFYFSHGIPVANYNLRAPTVGVTVANGYPEYSVASAALASVSRFPQQQCRAMSCHLFPIPSSGWAFLPTRTARLSLTRHRSQSSIPMAASSSKVDRTLTAPNFGNSLSPLLLHLQLTCHLWLQLLWGHLQPCQYSCLALAKASGLPALPGRTSWSSSCMRQPSPWPWQPKHPASPTTLEHLTSPASVHS
jgi:hypothetical protein